MRKEVFRVHDKIQIISPNIFVRCGYPLTKELAIKNLVTFKEKQKIADLVGVYLHNDDQDNLEPIWDELSNGNKSSAYFDILDKFALLKMRQNNFGGSERKVYTEFKPEYLNATGTILSKKCVQSGIHHSGGNYCGEWEPSYLANQKTHIILEVWLDCIKNNTYDSYRVKIEETWCKKI
jgi:hypothetical protein